MALGRVYSQHIFLVSSVQCVNPQQSLRLHQSFSFPPSFQLVALVDTVNDYTATLYIMVGYTFDLLAEMKKGFFSQYLLPAQDHLHPTVRLPSVVSLYKN